MRWERIRWRWRAKLLADCTWPRCVTARSKKRLMISAVNCTRSTRLGIVRWEMIRRAITRLKWWWTGRMFRCARDRGITWRRLLRNFPQTPLYKLLLLFGFGWRSGFGGFVFFQDGGGCGDAVAFFQAQQADALGRAAGLADFAGVHADDFALAGDDHHVGIFADLQSRDDGTIAVGGFQVDHALSAARSDAVFGERGALAVTLFGDGEHERGERLANLIAFQLVEIFRFFLVFLLNDSEVGLHRVHADDEVALGEIHAVDTAGGAAHGADFGFAEENSLAIVAGEENHLHAVGEFCADQLVRAIEIDRDDAGRTRVGKFGEAGFFHRAVFGGEEDVAIGFFQIARGNYGGELFIFLEAHQVGNGFTARGCGGFGNFVNFQPVDAALGSEEQDVAVRRGDEEMLDEIVVASFGADAAFAAARLVAIGFDRGAFDVARVADGDGHFLVFDEVFELDFLDAVNDLGAAFIAIGLYDFAQFRDDDGFQFLFAAEDFTQLGDLFADLFQLGENVVNGKLGEAVQLQFEDGVNLRKAKADDFRGHAIFFVD